MAAKGAAASTPSAHSRASSSAASPRRAGSASRRRQKASAWACQAGCASAWPPSIHSRACVNSACADSGPSARRASRLAKPAGKLAGAQPHFGQFEQRHRVVRGQRLHAQEHQLGMGQPLAGNQNPAQLAQAVQPVGRQLQGGFNGVFGFSQPLLLVAHLRQRAPGLGVLRRLGDRALGAARGQRAVAHHGVHKSRLNSAVPTSSGRQASS